MELLRQDLGIAFIKLLLRCHKIEKNLAVSVGLSVDELHCLTQIHSSDPYCVKELSGTLGMKASRTSIILGDLERRGLLTRSLSLTDKRMERLSLTQDGIRTAENALMIARQAVEKFLTSIPLELRGSFFNPTALRNPLIEQ